MFSLYIADREAVDSKMTSLACECPHLESLGEVTKEELIQKSHVSVFWPGEHHRGMFKNIYPWGDWVFSFLCIWLLNVLVLFSVSSSTYRSFCYFAW